MINSLLNQDSPMGNTKDQPNIQDPKDYPKIGPDLYPAPPPPQPEPQLPMGYNPWAGVQQQQDSSLF